MTQRAVFMADIHGNITGLRAVLQEVKKLEAVTHIVALGDFFGWSAGHNDLVELLLEHGVILIRGGHEELLTLIDEGRDGGKYYPEIYMTHDWLKKHLHPDTYAMMASLPTVFRLKLNDRDSLIAFHAAFNDMESYTCGPDRSLDVLRATYGGLPENLVLYGHYHEPHVLPMDGKLLVNCASVGARVRDSLSNYTVVEYDEEKFAIMQKQVPYDRKEEEELIKARGVVRRNA